MTRPIFIGGTSSHAGKSWMTTAICAWLRRRGIRVAPFKAQNMSNNSYPCRGGGEIGRAQAAQAWACGIEPEPAMNPILLKPEAEGRSQLVVNGERWQSLRARDYYAQHERLRQVVLAAYENLAARFDVILMEGAGSVTELNLRAFDLANLSLVSQLGASWLLVADIERGGVFASIIGTVHLLTAQERSLLKAFAVNKFRGDRSLFTEGQHILEQRTGVECLGVFPYSQRIHLDAEDSLSLPAPHVSSSSDVAIVRLPHISNTTDFRLLPDASWITQPIDRDFNFIFLPGTKSTVADLDWLRATGLADWIRIRHSRGAIVIGICGGFQMLGQTIADPLTLESDRNEAHGLGLLPLRTVMTSQKTTRVVEVRTPGGHPYRAFEIHLGETDFNRGAFRPFALLEGDLPEGIRTERIIGTYLHGAFEDATVLAEIGLNVQPAAGSGYADLADWFDPFGSRFAELFL